MLSQRTRFPSFSWLGHSPLCICATALSICLSVDTGQEPSQKLQQKSTFLVRIWLKVISSFSLFKEANTRCHIGETAINSIYSCLNWNRLLNHVALRMIQAIHISKGLQILFTENKTQQTRRLFKASNELRVSNHLEILINPPPLENFCFPWVIHKFICVQLG